MMLIGFMFSLMMRPKCSVHGPSKSAVMLRQWQIPGLAIMNEDLGLQEPEDVRLVFQLSGLTVPIPEDD
eukprot:14575968-Heterocapsa_arctica.AAC.1